MDSPSLKDFTFPFVTVFHLSGNSKSFNNWLISYSTNQYASRNDMNFTVTKSQFKWLLIQKTTDYIKTEVFFLNELWL